MNIVTRVKRIAKIIMEIIFLAGKERPEEKVGFFPSQRWSVAEIIAASKKIETIYAANKNNVIKIYLAEFAKDIVVKETMISELIAMKKKSIIMQSMPKAAQSG